MPIIYIISIKEEQI